jgi:hypothetical protein
VDVARIVIGGLIAERADVPDELASHRNLFHEVDLRIGATDHAASSTELVADDPYGVDVNTEWALGELRKFLRLIDYRDNPGLYRATYIGSDDEIAAQKVVVEKIWVRILGPKPVSPMSGNDPQRPNREWTIRCIETIVREAEIRDNLGEDAPDLSASNLHPWIWDGAPSLWQSGHFAEGVEAAAKKLNAETQNKVGRRDVAETNLFQQAFSDDPPQPGKARLRIRNDDGGRTAQSARRGVRAFAEGCYAGIRNPMAHDGGDLSESRALEQLAAFSVLARWVDEAGVDAV